MHILTKKHMFTRKSFATTKPNNPQKQKVRQLSTTTI